MFSSICVILPRCRSMRGEVFHLCNLPTTCRLTLHGHLENLSVKVHQRNNILNPQLGILQKSPQGKAFRVSRSYLILFYPIFLEKSYFVLLFGKCPILSYFLAILPLILVFYSLFITIISCKNIP